MLSGWLLLRVPALRLARFEEHEQCLGVRKHGVAVAEAAGYEDLSAFHPIDSRVDLQLLIDRDDPAVVDV
jgi:hypothetical protein